MGVGGQNIVRRRTMGSPMEYDALRCSTMSHRSPSYSIVGSVGPWLYTYNSSITLYNKYITSAYDKKDQYNIFDITDKAIGMLS